MNKNEATLVQVATSDSLLLHGFYSPGSKDKTLLFIHGFEGNFYENYFTQVIAKLLLENSVTFLTGNTRGSEKIKDFETIDGKIKTIGARYEILEESPLDIDSWIDFLIKKGHRNIILAGHSLGTLKAVRYLRKGSFKDQISKLILLAPFDKNGLLNKYITNPLGDLLTKAQLKINEGNGSEIISGEFDNTFVSYKTFLSWYKQDDFGKMWDFHNPSYDFPALKSITIPTKAIVGSKDEFFYPTNPSQPEEAMELLKKHIANCETKLISSADHCYRGFENEMATEILDFIMK